MKNKIYVHSVRPACPRCKQYALTGKIIKHVTYCWSCKAKVVFSRKYGVIEALPEAR